MSWENVRVFRMPPRGLKVIVTTARAAPGWGLGRWGGGPLTPSVLRRMVRVLLVSLGLGKVGVSEEPV